MRGVLLPGGSRVELRDFPDPVAGPGQAVIRIKASSICGSDVRAIYREHLGKGPEGYIDGTIAGHEPCGQVESVGPGVTTVRTGRSRGRLSHRRLRPVSRLPRRLHDQLHVAATSCLWLAARRWSRRPHAGRGTDPAAAPGATDVRGWGPGGLWLRDGLAGDPRADVSGRDRVLVTGLGPVGLATLMLAMASGAEVIGVDLQAERRSFAMRAWCRSRIRPDEALEGVRASHERCRRRGRHRLLRRGQRTPAVPGGCAAVGPGGVHRRGRGGDLRAQPHAHPSSAHAPWVVGHRPRRDGRPARSSSRAKDLHPDRIVTDRFSLDQTGEAYRMFDEGRTTGKVVVIP